MWIYSQPTYQGSQPQKPGLVVTINDMPRGAVWFDATTKTIVYYPGLIQPPDDDVRPDAIVEG